MHNIRYYSKYVRHCLRFYTRYRAPIFGSDPDENDWTACDRVFSKITEEEREILMYVYKEYDTLPDNVYQICKKKKISQDYVWRLMFKVEREVARERGLL